MGISKNKTLIMKKTKNDEHTGKMIVYGNTGYGKSYVIISNILREREKALLISANGDVMREFICMNLEGVDINVAEPKDFQLYDKVAIPKTGIPDVKMEEFLYNMLGEIESSGFSSDKTRTIIFTGFGEGHYKKDIVERLTEWKCQVVIEYMGNAKLVEKHEIPDIMNSKEWEKYPLYNSLRPGSIKHVPGLHFISGEGAEKFCDGLLSAGKGNATIEPRRLFGEDGFLIEDCDYVVMTADEQAAFYSKLMEMRNNMEATVRIRNL